VTLCSFPSLFKTVWVFIDVIGFVQCNPSWGWLSDLVVTNMWLPHQPTALDFGIFDIHFIWTTLFCIPLTCESFLAYLSCNLMPHGLVQCRYVEMPHRYFFTSSLAKVKCCQFTSAIRLKFRSGVSFLYRPCMRPFGIWKQPQSVGTRRSILSFFIRWIAKY
jgi:hypothetical protein